MVNNGFNVQNSVHLNSFLHQSPITKPQFNDFDFSGRHKKLFEEEFAMEYLTKGVDSFLMPNFFSQSFLDDFN